MSNNYKNCQSCGMPMNKDPDGGGSEADGTRSNRYCSHCYKDGNFAQPDITVDEMKQLVKEKMAEMKIPGFMGWFFTRGIPKLERWRHVNS